jgi:hypothetical protein
MCTRAYRFSGNTPASPAQWLYGLWRDLLGDEFCFVTVAAGLRLKRSGWIASATDSLTPATGARTTRFCRTQQPVVAKWLRQARRRSSARRSIAHGKPPCDLVRADAAASTASRPTFVTMANAPLSGRDPTAILLIWVRRQAKFRKIRSFRKHCGRD